MKSHFFYTNIFDKDLYRQLNYENIAEILKQIDIDFLSLNIILQYIKFIKVSSFGILANIYHVYLDNKLTKRKIKKELNYQKVRSLRILTILSKIFKIKRLSLPFIITHGKIKKVLGVIKYSKNYKN